MPLDLTHILKADQWLKGRDHYPAKAQQVKWIEQFNNGLSCVNSNKNLSVSYLTNDDLSYVEGTPIFHWFKLTKNAFFITHGYEDHRWQEHNINPNIREIIFRNGVNKWTTSDDVLDIEPGFILFPIQTFSAQLELIIEIVKWADRNKTRVLFRPHPYPQEDIDEDLIWLRLVDKLGVDPTYVTFSGVGNIDIIVDRCQAVWTHNSGVGMQALLKGKPVAYFLKDFDHTYGNVATFCTSVAQAAEAPPPNPKDVDRFFSWYYDEVAIDLSDVNYIDRMQERVNGV